MTAATTVQSEPLAVGVDGCRAGWIAVARGESRLDYQLHTTFSELLRAWPSTATVFVDIPIGLPSSACPSRRCDTEARQRLGSSRASSVFSPPCREAAYATNLKLAREINLREVGKSLSAQAWGICMKIAEVDTLLGGNPALVHRVKEVHPELIFWALNAGRAMRHAKKSKEGALERAELIGRIEPRAPELVERVLSEHRRSKVGRDDVVDALAAMLTAGAGHEKPWKPGITVPSVPEIDDMGLPMCMWIPAGAPDSD